MKPASTDSKASRPGPKLVQGPIGKSLYSMMIPMIIGMLAMISYNVADTYFIGQIGTLELAAISFTFPVSFFVIAVVMALGVGTSSVCSRLFGANEHEEVSRVALHAILLGTVISISVMILGLNTIDPLFRMLGADETTLPIIHRYMEIYYWGGVFVVVPMIANSVMRSAGNTKTPAMIMMIAALMNIILDPILIFGFMGIPALGVEGAAIATVLANAGTLIASLFIVIVRSKIIQIKTLYAHLLIDSWRRILHVGLPTMTSTLIAPVTTAFITYQIAQFGQEAVAGFGVASRVEGLSLLCLMSLSGAITPFVGQNFGAGRFDRVKAGVSWCYRFSFAYGIFAAAVIALSSTYIASAFTESSRAIEVAQLQMMIVPFSYFALGFSMVANSVFNALGKPMPAMYISLSRTVLVYAPLAFLFAELFGVVGIFAAACTANFISGSIGVVWLRKAFKTIEKIEEKKQTAEAPAT